MDQVFIEGFRVPVTKIQAGPCVITQIKSGKKDGYWAIQLGFGERKTKNISKPEQGHLKKSTNKQVNKSTNLPRYLREARLKEEPKLNVGDQVKASDIFHIGDKISVVGISKGKGFAGVVKRWHFKGGPKTHGQSDRQRAPGSIGTTTTPGRVLKGKHMAGRMGSARVTVKNLHIVALEPEKGEISVSGPVPGRFGGNLIIKRISAGNLAELEHEKVTQVVEGEAETVSAPPNGNLENQGGKNA